jgi:hypothetical protein
MRIEETLAGGAQIKRDISGRYITVKSAGAEVIVSGRNIDPVHIGQAETYDLGSRFDNKEILIKNSSTGSNSFVMEVTQYQLTKSNEANFDVTTTATIEHGNDNNHLPKVSIPAGQAAALAPANASRKELRVSLLSSAPGLITLGKNGVNANSGGALEPGMVDYITTEGALFAHNPNAEAVEVYVMEVNKL